MFVFILVNTQTPRGRTHSAADKSDVNIVRCKRTQAWIVYEMTVRCRDIEWHTSGNSALGPLRRNNGAVFLLLNFTSYDDIHWKLSRVLQDWSDIFFIIVFTGNFGCKLNYARTIFGRLIIFLGFYEVFEVVKCFKFI